MAENNRSTQPLTFKPENTLSSPTKDQPDQRMRKALLDAFELSEDSYRLLWLLRTKSQSANLAMAICGVSDRQTRVLDRRHLIIRSRERNAYVLRLDGLGAILLEVLEAREVMPRLLPGTEFLFRESKQAIAAGATGTRVKVALDPSPSIRGEVVLTPQCAYNPLCAEAPPFDGILVTFVNDLGKGVEHRNYCCELHAAFDLLNEVSYLGRTNILSMVRRSLKGEPMLGDRIPQSTIDSQVEAILGGCTAEGANAQQGCAQ